MINQFKHLKNFDQVDNFIKEKIKEERIKDITDLFNLIQGLVEYIDKFSFLTGEEKGSIVFDNLVIHLYSFYHQDEAVKFVVLINPFIENLILLSKSKLLLNVKKNCSSCFL